jgi:NAD(P)-dependent dehydrogenase (short-subunit alcohol dehydrogenase family)
VDLGGAVAVVTGGGAGIGAALARRFAADGAHVVVNDVEGARATRVAHEVGGHAVACDASSGEGIAHLLDETRATYGEIDLYCANAGVARGGGPQAPDEAWDTSWEVNVMAHVRAARALLPAWLARGRGHFLATVSAAGLLSHVTAAPYAVSKHGALAFAEWLSIAYGDRGITVQALCPQGVRTDMLLGGDDAGMALLLAEALAPDEVADTVARELASGRFLILPHPQVARYELHRATDRDRWLSGMRRIHEQVTAARSESTESTGGRPAAPTTP